MDWVNVEIALCNLHLTYKNASWIVAALWSSPGSDHCLHFLLVIPLFHLALRHQKWKDVTFCLRYRQPLFLLVWVELELNIQKSSIFVLLLGCVDNRFFVLCHEWVMHEKCTWCHDSGKLKLNVGSQRNKHLLPGMPLPRDSVWSSYPCVFPQVYSSS